MVHDYIEVLKAIAKEQIVSVEYYPNGKCYRIPMAAFFLDASYNPFDDDSDDDMSVFVNCEYTTQLGMMYMQCKVLDGNGKLLVAPISIPLDKKKQNQLHREFVSLINLCSKRVIAQEMSRTRYAITSAINSIIMNKKYS